MITTELPHCTLRPWQADDLPALLHHANNRAVWLNMADIFPHPYTQADGEFWLSIAGQAGPNLNLSIVVDGQAAGGIGLMAGEGNFRHTALVGYWLGQDHWGRGVATAALSALVAHAWAELPFERLEARVFAWNPASMRVLEKAGFSREGLHPRSITKDGQVIDSVMYGCVRG